MWLLGLMLFGFAACSEDEVGESLSRADNPAPLQVEILLSTGGDGKRASRVTSDHPQGDGDGNSGTLPPGAGIGIGSENGLSYDNHIAHNDVTVLVFESEDNDGDGIYDDGLFVEQALVSSVRLFRDVEGSNYTEDDLYQVSATLLQLASGGYAADAAFQLVVLCNLGVSGNSMIQSNLEELVLHGMRFGEFVDRLTYSGYTSKFTQMLVSGKDNQKARIPMYGTIRTTSLIPSEGEHTVSGLVVPVIRAMAQVRVKLDLKNTNLRSDYVLKGVKLHHFNTGGTPIAVGKADGTNSAGSYDYAHDQAICAEGYTITYEDGSTAAEIPAQSTNYNNATHTGIVHPSIPAGMASEEELAFYQLQYDTEKSLYEYVLYIPEYRNIAFGDRTVQPASYIDLELLQTKYDGPVRVNTTLHFADYSGTTSGAVYAPQWDVIRNDIYDYKISVINEGELSIYGKVTPWTEASSEIGWGVNNTDAEGDDVYEIKFDNADTEARMCFICKPRYGTTDGHMLLEDYTPSEELPLLISPEDYAKLSTEQQAKYTTETVYHASLNNNSSEATYKLTFNGPRGAVWKAFLSNTDDFSLGNTNETGISREEYYTINISARNSWYETTDAGGNAYTPLQFDRRLTQYGRIWESTGGPETDFYIVVSTDGLNEFEVVINPPCLDEYYQTYAPLKAKIDEGKAEKAEIDKYNAWVEAHPYKDYRQYPGTDTRIRLKQLKARCGEGYYPWGDRYK